MIGHERQVAFESMVLSGIWLMILIGLGKRPLQAGNRWRANVLMYFDYHGVQGDDARAYRRETTFPELYP